MIAAHASAAMPVVCSWPAPQRRAYDLGTYPDRIPIIGKRRANTRWGLVQLVLSVMQAVIDESARGARRIKAYSFDRLSR